MVRQWRKTRAALEDLGGGEEMKHQRGRLPPPVGPFGGHPASSPGSGPFRARSET